MLRICWFWNLSPTLASICGPLLSLIKDVIMFETDKREQVTPGCASAAVQVIGKAVHNRPAVSPFPHVLIEARTEGIPRAIELPAPNITRGFLLHGLWLSYRLFSASMVQDSNEPVF